MSITTDYFHSNIMIPISANPDLNSSITEAITRYEKEILRLLLGYELWKEYTEAIAASVLDEGAEGYVALDQKWIDLRDGADLSFELHGITINTRWEGLENADKISLIAYYVYYQYRKYNETQFTGLGEKSQNSENSSPADYLQKMIWVQNEMVNLYGSMPSCLNRNKYYFQNLDNYDHFNDEPSAYNFLLANKEDYPSWIFKPIVKENYLGI